MSRIDPTLPVFGNPETASVRGNFQTTKDEIEELTANSATKAELETRLPLSGGVLTGALTLAGPPTTNLHAATKAYVDTKPFLQLSGGTMSGSLLLSGAPTVTAGAATKGYVETTIAASEAAAGSRFLSVAGGTMNGALLLATEPTDPRGAATKDYVDHTVSGVAGVSEAPNDGFIYGRGNIAWSRVLPVTGGTLNGTLSVGALAPPAGKLPSVNTADIALADAGNVAWNAWRSADEWTYRQAGAATVLARNEAGGLGCLVALSGQAGEVVRWYEAWRVDETGNFVSARNIMASSPDGNAFVGSWHSEAGGSNVGLWNSDNTLWFGNADGHGQPTSGRMSLDGANNLLVLGSVQSPNLIAFSAAGTWDGGALRVGANWTHHWSFAVDGVGVLNIARSDIGAAMTIDTAGSLGVPGNISTGGTITGGAVNSNGDMWAAGTMTAQQGTFSNVTAHGTIGAAAVNSNSMSTSAIFGLWDLSVGGTLTAQFGTFTHATVHGTINANAFSGDQIAVQNATVHGAINTNHVTSGLVDVTGLGVRYLGFGGFPIAFQWDGANTFVIVNGQGVGHIPGPDYSDERVKTVSGVYSRGLAEVLQINPIIFRSRGNDYAPGAENIRDTEREHVGISAQEVEHVIPELVRKREGFIDGEAVEDLRELTGAEPLVYALLNSIKELHAIIQQQGARITALEGAT